MATNTYVALRTETVAVATNSVTFSLSGISGYTDLRVVINGACDTGTANVLMRYNNDSTSTLYSVTSLTGDGSSATSIRNGTQNQIILNYYGYMDTTYRTNVLVDIFQYANTNVFKTNISRANNSANGTAANVGLWRNTAAITSVTFVTGSNNFAVGTTFSLYGIKAVGGDTTPKATGGVVTEDSTYYYHTFKGSSTFTALQSLSADWLVVAGGGGGGGDMAGGGGAGGLRCTVTATGGGGTLETPLSFSAGAYTVLVGAGGAAQPTDVSNGFPGNNSSILGTGISTVTSTGGGYGGYFEVGGGPGGSGGGAGRTPSGGGGTRTASPVQGNNGGGGSGSSGTFASAGGGGGAGGVGANGSTSGAGNGGAGLALSAFATPTSTGVSTFYAGGGGGGAYDAPAASGGSGGGGAGGKIGISGNAGGNATANTGSGGGGGGPAGGNGGAGGSGIVVIRYAK